MSAQIKWLKTALRNFEDEIDFIAAHDPSAARIVSRRIIEAVTLLSSHPSIGRPGRIAGTRELVVPHTRYLIPYRVKHGIIEILRVFHATRRPPKTW
jgi:toxin ParE1/3/4